MLAYREFRKDLQTTDEFIAVARGSGRAWIDGNTSMKDMRTELKKAKITFKLPKSDAKLVRRAVMVCTRTAANCDFVFLTVDTVKSAR